MSALTAFEVQSFRNGEWKIEAITDNKDLAVHQAEHIIKNATIKKVRVVQETVDPNSAKQKTRIVFVRDRQAVKPPEAPAGQPAASEHAIAPGQAVPSEQTAAPALAEPARQSKPWNMSAIGLILTFGAIVIAGIAVILAIRYVGANP